MACSMKIRQMEKAAGSDAAVIVHFGVAYRNNDDTEQEDGSNEHQALRSATLVDYMESELNDQLMITKGHFRESMRLSLGPIGLEKLDECGCRTTEARSTLKREIKVSKPVGSSDTVQSTSSRSTNRRLEFWVDLTDLATLSVLLAPPSGVYPWPDHLLREVTESTEPSQFGPEGKMSSARLQPLVSAQREWWDRPAWAWTSQETLLAHGAIAVSFLLDATEAWLESKTWNACLSATVSPSVSLSRSILWTNDWPCSLHERRTRLLLLNPIADHGVITGLLESERDDRKSLLFTKESDRASALGTDPTELELVRVEEEPASSAGREIDYKNAPCPVHVGRTTETEQSTVDDRPADDHGPLRTCTPEMHVTDSSRSGVEQSHVIVENTASVMSQLPANLRSEARIAMALHESRRRMDRAGKRNTHLHRWLSQDTDSPEQRQSSKRTRSNKQDVWLDASEIDPDTLQELPEDIRNLIRIELSQGHRKRTKKAGLSLFFARAKR